MKRSDLRRAVAPCTPINPQRASDVRGRHRGDLGIVVAVEVGRRPPDSASRMGVPIESGFSARLEPSPSNPEATQSGEPAFAAAHDRQQLLRFVRRQPDDAPRDIFEHFVPGQATSRDRPPAVVAVRRAYSCGRPSANWPSGRPVIASRCNGCRPDHSMRDRRR